MCILQSQSRGDVITILDADLQNDPADIHKLLLKIKEGFDVVSGWRKQRKDPLLRKRIPSYLGNSFMYNLADNKRSTIRRYTL